MKLLGSTKSKIKITMIINITQKSCIHFVSNKSFAQLLDILSQNCVFLNTFNSEFLFIDVWFTDQNSKPLDIEDNINITLVINY